MVSTRKIFDKNAGYFCHIRNGTGYWDPSLARKSVAADKMAHSTHGPKETNSFNFR